MNSEPPLVEGPLGASEWRDTRRTALEKITVSTFSRGVAVITPSSRASCVSILARKFLCSVTLREGVGGLLSASSLTDVPRKCVRDGGVTTPPGAGSSQVATPVERDRWTSQCGKSLWRPSDCSRGQRHDQPSLGEAAARHEQTQASTLLKIRHK